MKPSLVHIAAAALVAGLHLPAQEEAPPVREAREVLEAQWKTNTHARALRLRIPAPRGLITDRHGRPLAQNRVVRQMAINFPLLRNATDAEILAFARRQFASAGTAVGQNWDLEDKVILNHYQNRRWLPLTFTPILTEEQEKKLEPLKSEHLFLHASYQRFYPQGNSAAHIVGYVGKVGWFPTGPAENGDPLWEDSEGRAGLELTMDKELKGKEGGLSALFGADGSRISWEVETKPVPGHTVVTTIDLAMQKRVESILAQNSRRGAYRGDGCENRRGAGDGLLAQLRSEHFYSLHQRGRSGQAER
jgi:penicillin-binding protein 2